MGEPCCWLPHALTICPTCSAGIKQARGWTWIEPAAIFEGKKCVLPGAVHALTRTAEHDITREFQVGACPVSTLEGRHGLIWIGEKFYPTPADFIKEGDTQGISRRLSTVPKGLEIGKTWVLLAHPKVIKVSDGTPFDINAHYEPAIFSVFKPTRIEIIIKESELTEEKREELEKRGLTPFVVPDDDPNHCPKRAA
ncbi:MAG: hypothetical protein V3V08_22055 [Nannocystaceae bacterium]